MCEKLGIPESVMCNVENGKRKPPRNLVGKLIEKYRLNEEHELSVVDAIDLTDGKVTVDMSQATQQEKLMLVMFMEAIYRKDLPKNKAKELIAFVFNRAKWRMNDGNKNRE